MTEFVRAKFEDGSVASVSADRAKSRKLEVVPDSQHTKAYAADYSKVKLTAEQKKQES